MNSARGISFKAFTAALIVGVMGLPAFAAPQPKAGATCTKKGATATANNKKFTCVLKGKKLVWNSGVLISVPVAQPTPITTPTVALAVDFSRTYNTDEGYLTPFQFGACEYEKDIPEQWRALQDYFTYNCPGIFQLATYELGSLRPKTPTDSDSAFGNVTPCKLLTPDDVRPHMGFTTPSASRNWYHEQRRYPSPNSVIQIIPFYTEEMSKPSQSPESTYGRYAEYLRRWIDYSSDFGSKAVVKIPSEYLKITGRLSDYPMEHEKRPEDEVNTRFRNALLSSVDPFIDFTGVNVVIAVPPPGISNSAFSQGFLGTLQTREGDVNVAISAPAYLAADPQYKFSNLVHPWMWLHELQHAGWGFQDTYGDGSLTSTTDFGMGQFGLMSPTGGDYLTWMKWVMGFMRDSQVHCVTSDTSSTHWLVPATVKSTLTKSVIIPITASKGIVIESLRPGGLNYKQPKQSQGVLVYTVDAANTLYDRSLILSLPFGRTVISKPFWMADAPLKLGEHTISNGWKITVVESGTFGDVVRVEKL